MTGAARELRINAFPRGDGLWRVDWFGGVAFPDRTLRRTQPSVFVHLSKVVDAAVLGDPSVRVGADSTQHWKRQFKCWVSVGTTMLLRIGDLWSGQAFVASPEHEVETFENIRIDRSAAQLLKVGHSDQQGHFLLPAAEHPWHMHNTHSYCVKVDLGGGRSLVVPCMELALFYFGSSSELLSRLFLPPFNADKLYTKVQLSHPGGSAEIDLTEGIPRESAADIARIALDTRARHAAAGIGASLLRPVPEGVYDLYPQCFFPFEGATALEASGKWLSLGEQPHATFMVYRLRSCSHPFPFRALKFRNAGTKRRRSVPQSGNSNDPSEPRRRYGAPDAQGATLRERDASSALAPRPRRLVRELKFPDLVDKPIWSEAAINRKAPAAVGAPKTTAVDDVAVGAPGSSARVRPITLVEAMGQPSGPPNFIKPAIERLARLKRLKAIVLTASLEDGWSVPIPYEVDAEGEISPRAFTVDGGRLRRVAAFVVLAARTRYHFAVIEGQSGGVEVHRVDSALCLEDILRLVRKCEAVS